MKELERVNSSTSQTSVEDAVILPSRRLRGSGLRIAAGLAALVLIAGIGWATNHFYNEPKRDAAVVEKVRKKWLSTIPASRREIEERLQSKRSSEDRLWQVVERLKGLAQKTQGSEEALDYHAVLRHAIRSGIPEAKLLLGIALRDGVFGPRDSATALRMFDEVARGNEDGLRAGDAIAMYTDARMWLDGLGRLSDPAKARALARQAGPNLHGWRLEDVANDVVFSKGPFAGVRDHDLEARLAERMIDQGLSSVVELVWFICLDPNGADYTSCKHGWYERAAKSGMESAYSDYARGIIASGGSLKEADKWFALGAYFNGPEEHFQQAFVQAITSTTDRALLEAIARMWKHAKAEIATNKPISSSEERTNWLTPFYDRAEKVIPATEMDNFGVALSAYGLLIDQVNNAVDGPWSFSFKSAESVEKVERILSKSNRSAGATAAKAILNGQPLDEVVLLQKGKPWRFVPLPEAEVGATSVSKRQPVKAVTPVDREQQAFTGYLKGEQKGAMGGLSTFTVDNRRGDRDAVARIYLNGDKPAVLHIYIKKGETFKAQSIQAGTYVFRYRYIGSEDTYEANQPFQLTETRTDTGTRFSNVTVTLFKVKDGNMQTKKVDASKF